MTWLHRLFNPHCLECKDNNICKSCETLRAEVAYLRYQNEQLIKQLTHPQAEEVEAPKVNLEEIKPIQPRHIPWNVRREILEAADRKEAALRAEQAKVVQASIDNLEKELGLDLENGTNVQSKSE